MPGRACAASCLADAEVAQQHHEFIAAETRHEVAIADRSRQPVRHQLAAARRLCHGRACR
jgi:hypothetical protein